MRDWVVQFLVLRGMALLGNAACFLLSPPHRSPQCCIHGTNRIGPCAHQPARSHIICDRHLCLPSLLRTASAAEHPCCCPRPPPSPEIYRKQSMVPGCLQLCRFSSKLQLSWFAFVVVLFLR